MVQSQFPMVSQRLFQRAVERRAEAGSEKTGQYRFSFAAAPLFGWQINRAPFPSAFNCHADPFQDGFDG
jgi:hypothetical protein